MNEQSKFIDLDGLKSFLGYLQSSFDTVVTEGSTNAVTSGAVYTAIDNIEWHGTLAEADAMLKAGAFVEGQLVNITDDVDSIDAATASEILALF